LRARSPCSASAAVQVAAFALRQRRDGAAETLELRVQALAVLALDLVVGETAGCAGLGGCGRVAELLVLLLLLLLLLLLVVGQSSVPLRLSLGRPRFRWTRFGAGKSWSVLSVGEWRFSDASELAGEAGVVLDRAASRPRRARVLGKNRAEMRSWSRGSGFMVLNGRPFTNMFSFR